MERIPMNNRILLAIFCTLTPPVLAEEAFNPGYTNDLTVWPNVKSFRNSDPWIVANHDRIRRLEPRVLARRTTGTVL